MVRDTDRNKVTEVRRAYIATVLQESDPEEVEGTIDASRLAEIVGEERIAGSKPYTSRMAVSDLKHLAKQGILIEKEKGKYVINSDRNEESERAKYGEAMLELQGEFN